MSDSHAVMAAEIERQRSRAVQAEHDRNEAWIQIKQLKHERDTLLEKLGTLETASWADAVQGEAARKGRAEVAELALTSQRASYEEMAKSAAQWGRMCARLRERLAVMREAAEPVGGCVWAVSHQSTCPYVKRLRDALAPDAGRPEAEVLRLGRDLVAAWDGPERFGPVWIEFQKAVEALGEGGE